MLELTLPEDDKEQQKGDSESVATITTDTNSNENCLENNLNEKIKFEKNGKESKELTIKNRLKVCIFVLKYYCWFDVSDL